MPPQPKCYGRASAREVCRVRFADEWAIRVFIVQDAVARGESAQQAGGKRHVRPLHERGQHAAAQGAEERGGGRPNGRPGGPCRPAQRAADAPETWARVAYRQTARGQHARAARLGACTHAGQDFADTLLLSIERAALHSYCMWPGSSFLRSVLPDRRAELRGLPKAEALLWLPLISAKLAQMENEADEICCELGIQDDVVLPDRLQPLPCPSELEKLRARRHGGAREDVDDGGEQREASS